MTQEYENQDQDAPELPESAVADLPDLSDMKVAERVFRVAFVAQRKKQKRSATNKQKRQFEPLVLHGDEVLFTYERVFNYLRLIRIGMPVSRALKQVGVPGGLFQRWMHLGRESKDPKDAYYLLARAVPMIAVALEADMLKTFRGSLRDCPAKDRAALALKFLGSRFAHYRGEGQSSSNAPPAPPTEMTIKFVNHQTATQPEGAAAAVALDAAKRG